MTSKTSAFLFATLVLSSGVCFAEAFSVSATTPTITTRLHGQPSPSTARYYAPKDSLESGGPKRRRGRPQTSDPTTTTAAKTPSKKGSTTTSTSAAASESVAELTGVKRRSRKRSNHMRRVKPTKRTASDGNTDYVMDFLLNHDLLSKEEERLLGAKIRLASEMQERMTMWITENQARIQQQREYQQMESLLGDSLFNSEEELDADNPLFGSASSQAIEHYYAVEPDEELFYPDGTPFLENEYLGDYTVFRPQPQKLSPLVPASWMDEILLQGDDYLSMYSILSDQDIRKVLKLKGGRSELRSILLEGALAREKLIRSNIKLVYSIAKKWVGDTRMGTSLVRAYSTGRPTLDEAMQEGIMGLAEAAERFDPERGFRFSTYATMWVTNSVRKCLQLESTSGLRLPIPYYDMKTKYVKIARDYLATEGQVPSIEVIADQLGVSTQRLVAAVQLTQPLASLDASIGGASRGFGQSGKSGAAGEIDSDYTLASLLASEEPQPEDICERSLLRQCLENAMATELSPNERDVVRLRLGLDDGVPQSAKEVADIFGGRFSQAAIRSMETRAFNKLRSPFGVHSQQLLAYLDFAGIDGRNLGQ